MKQSGRFTWIAEDLNIIILFPRASGKVCVTKQKKITCFPNSQLTVEVLLSKCISPPVAPVMLL